MARASVDIKMEECPICTEEYRDARVLECGHHFCRVCLEEIATGHPDGHVTCPTCRHITKTTGKDDISKLQKYSLINDFVGSVNDFDTFSKKHGTEDETFSRPCDICENKATCYCALCHLMYCNTCLSDHEDLPEHKLYPITPAMFCKPHQDYALSYCKTCQAACCHGRCLVAKHKSHSKCSIEIAEKAAKEQLLESSKYLKSGCDEEEILENVKKAINNITVQRTEMSTGFKLLETAVESLLGKVKEVWKEINEKMDSELKNLGMMKADLNDFVASKVKLKGMVDSLLEEVAPHALIAKHQNLPKYNSQVKDHLTQFKMSQIPGLDISFDKTIQSLKKIEESLSPTLQELNFTRIYKEPITNVTLLKTFNSHQRGEPVGGIVADVEKKELVVRCQHQQEPITIFDYDGNKKRTLGTWIPGIAAIPYQGINLDTKRGLYVLPVAGDIMLMDKQGNKTGQFKVSNKMIHGICYNSDKDVYITCSNNSFDGDNKVYIINAVDRNVTFSFLGIPSFGVAYGHVNVKGTNTHVIAVSGYGTQCVKVYDFQGNVLYTVGVEGQYGTTDGYLLYPWGVCIDPSGKILVGGDGNNRVVSVDDKSWEQLLSGNHPAPHVTFDPSAKRLFVAGCSQPFPISIYSY